MTYAVIPLAVAVLCIYLGRRLVTLLVILAYLSVEGLLKLLSNYNPVVHVGMDLVVLIVSAAWVVEAVVMHRAHLPRLPLAGLIGLYAVWIVLQVFNPYSPGLLPSLAAFKTHLTMIPLYFITAAMVRTKEDVLRLFGVLAAIGLVPYVAALVQYAAGPQSVLDLSPRYWQNASYFHEWRPFGTSAVPGGAAVFAFLIVPVALAAVLATRGRARMRGVAAASIALGAGTFVVSGVRQVLLACALAVVCMAGLMISRGRGRGVVALLVLTIAGVGAYVTVQAALTPLAKESLASDPRVPAIWRQQLVTDRLSTLTEGSTFLKARQGGLRAIATRIGRYPFGAGLGRTGSGAGAFGSTLLADPTSARIQAEVGWSDNFFADELVEAGIPGLLLLVVIMVWMTASAMRLARRARDPVVFSAASAIAGLFVAYLVISWGSQPLLANPTLAYFWCMAGVLASLRRIEAEANPARVSPPLGAPGSPSAA